MPESSAYRKNTENIIRERADIVFRVCACAFMQREQNVHVTDTNCYHFISQQTESVADIEARIKCGRIEELIVQAENELILARRLLVYKPWDKLFRTAPPRQWEWPPARVHPQN